MGSEYAHMISNLIAVITLIFVLVFVMKKLKIAKYAGNKHIKIINVVPIGPKEKLMLMEVNNVFLLVGATANHIETLYVFNELSAAEVAVEEQLSKNKKISFSEQFKRLVGQST